jgi:urease accessory protein
MRLPRTAPALALLLAILAPAAQAHTGADAGLHHGFISGFLHPLAGADHLAAMVAVGLWSALTARRAWPDLLWAPLGFASMLLVGALAGLAGLSLPALEPMIAASLLVLGLLVLTQRRLAPAAAAALVGAFALFHGAAHGMELAGHGGAALALAGMLAATLMLHAGGIALGLTLRQGPRWSARIAGAAVALFGAALLGGVA